MAACTEANFGFEKDTSNPLSLVWFRNLKFLLGAGRENGRNFRSTTLERYSTVTDFARLRGWSTSVPLITAVW